MARPTAFDLTNDPIIDLSTAGYYWQLDSDRTIRWALSNGFNGEFWSNPDKMVQYIDGALDVFSVYSDINFEYVGHFNNPSEAYAKGSDITVSLDGASLFTPNPGVWAVGYPPYSSFDISQYAGASGDVFINVNSEANTLQSYVPGSAGWFLLIHELGHTLGLKHTHDNGGTGRPTATGLGIPEVDIDWASIMSYNDTFDLNRLEWDPATPMFLDVIGLQYLYGANPNTNAGNSVLRIETISDYRTLWDSSGDADYVDAGSTIEGVEIKLPVSFDTPLTTTPVGTAGKLSESNSNIPTSGYWLMGDIENAAGSQFDDRIVGNTFPNILIGRQGNDQLVGQQGNDHLDGNAGIDYAIYGVTRNQAGIAAIEDGFSVTSPEGADILVNIERLSFTDGNIALDIDGIGGRAYRIYKAAFDRTPDIDGVGYWIAQMDQGMELDDVADQFIDSSEFKTQYGNEPSNNEFLSALYSNVLDRGPDNEGFIWWLEQLDNNPEKTPNKVLADFSESPENQSNVISLIENGFAYTFWDVNFL